MKISTVIIHILLSILLFLLLALSVSIYIRLAPPESVVLVVFRMPYQMLSKYINIVSAIGVMIYIIVIWMKGLIPEKYSLILAVGFGILGDKLYCGLYGNVSKTGTFAGETKVLDESVFGVKGSADNFYHEASVLHLIGNQNIPTLLIGGSADSMVVVEDTRKLYQYMAEKEMDCVYLELPGVEHAFDIVDNAARKRACVEMRKWLDTVFAEK